MEINQDIYDTNTGKWQDQFRFKEK
jgi:hypothetical protein